MFELIFYQDKIKWKHLLLPIEKTEIDSGKVID